MRERRLALLQNVSSFSVYMINSKVKRNLLQSPDLAIILIGDKLLEPLSQLIQKLRNMLTFTIKICERENNSFKGNGPSLEKIVEK